MIETHDLTKKYGELFAVKSLRARPRQKGDVFGFIGPNGAGKTTTMRILATLLNPTWGEAYVCGHSIYTQPQEIRRMIGYMPDFFGVYDDMKVIEYLEFFAAAYRIKGAAAPQSLRRSARPGRPGLQARRPGHQPVARHDAAAGPGPRAAARSASAAARRTGQRARPAGPHRNPRRCSSELRKMGKTIMVSSHILPELADICNKIGIIERGELLVNADVERRDEASPPADDSERRRGRRTATAPRKLLEDHPSVEKVEPRGNMLVVTLVPDATRLQPTWPRCLIAGRLQADALQGRRAEPGNGLHGADQGHHVVATTRAWRPRRRHWAAARPTTPTMARQMVDGSGTAVVPSM